MADGQRGLQLRCRDGHFEMAMFDLKRQEDGYWMWVACELDGHRGGHWLAPDPSKPQGVVVVADPYCWPSAVEAFAACDRWEAQEGDE